MKQTVITSADDPKIQVYRQLPRRNSSGNERHFVIEGRWLVQRLISSEVEATSILCGRHQADEFAALSGDIPLYVAERSLIEQIVGFEFHRGVLACGLRPEPLTLEETAEGAGQPALFAACAGVCDQENLGSVIRNCRAFGVDALLVDAHCADAYSRRVMRVSAGTALDLPIVESSDLWHDLVRLQNDRGFKLVATVIDSSAVPMEESRVDERMAIAFGNEGHGLDVRAREMCDYQVTLPMQGGVDSLNVGVASGILLNHYSLLQRSLIS